MPGAAVTEMKSRPKKTPSTVPLSNKALASGDESADSASAKSRVPASITVWPGRNLRVAGFGVCSVRISTVAMWSCGRLRSSTEWRRSCDHPAADGHGDDQADDRDPPFARSHRLGARTNFGFAGDHRFGQAPPAHPVEKDCCNVQGDECDNDILKP